MAVLPSRLLNCSPPPSFHAERSTPQTVKFIFTKPKFAFVQLSVSRRMAHDVCRQNSLVSTDYSAKKKFQVFKRIKQFAIFRFVAEGGERLSSGGAKPPHARLWKTRNVKTKPLFRAHLQ